MILSNSFQMSKVQIGSYRNSSFHNGCKSRDSFFMGLSQQQKIRHREQEDSKKGVIEPFYEEETIKANNDDTSIGIQESSFSVYRCHSAPKGISFWNFLNYLLQTTSNVPICIFNINGFQQISLLILEKLWSGQLNHAKVIMYLITYHSQIREQMSGPEIS